MSGPTEGSPAAAAEPHPLAAAYRRFGEGCGAAAPVSRCIALAVSESAAALRAVATAPARKRQPTLILAALSDLALAGRAPALAAAYAARDGEAAATAAISTLVELTDQVVATAVRRPVRTLATARCAVLRPAIAAAAHRVGATAVALIGLSGSVGLDLQVDRVGITYGDGPTLGDPSSPVQLRAAVVGRGAVPVRAMPSVVARVGIDREPVDLTTTDEARWLRACLGPDQPAAVARLEAALAVAAADPARLLTGDPVDVLPLALDAVPAGALPVVVTTWALSRLTPEDRLRFLQRLDEAATDRPVAWVSVEGVGVAPAIPTLGDRRASGHSIVGVAVAEHATLRTEAVGRCWSRGRLLSWLADG